MPTFQEIYNKYNSAQEKGLIKQDESLSTFAQRGFQVTGDPSYKNIADSGWFSNSLRSRSADLSNFIESGPVDEFTSETIGRIGDLFGITPSSSRAVGKKLPRMAVDFIPMAVGAAFAAPTGGASLLPALGMAGTSVLSAASAFEDTGRPLDAIIGGAVPYLGTKLAQMGSAAALRAAEKSKFLNRLGIQGGTTEVGAALNAAEKAQLASQGLSAPVIGATTVDRTVVKSLADKAFGYGAGQAAANTGFFGLDTLRYGPETTFTKDYLFNSLVGNLAFGLADIPRAFRPTVVSSRFNVPKAQDVYRTPGEERMHRALAMFKDLEDPRQIESLKRQYGLDIANIELTTEKLRTAQYLRTEEAQAEKQNFATKWNEFLDTDPLFNQATNGAFKITQGGAFGKDLVNFDAVMNAENLPPKAQVIVDAYKQKAQNVKARYTSAVNSLADGANLYDGLQRSVEEMGLDQFVQTPVEQRDYHKALKDSFLSPEGIDLVRDIQRKEANLEPLNPELFQEFMDFYSGKRTDLDFDRRADMAVAVSLARGAVPKLKEAKVKAKIAEQEGQKLQDVVEAGLKPVEEQARKLVIDSTPYQELQAKIAQDEAERLRLEAEDELNKTKMEIQRSTDVTARQAAYERLKVQQVELAKREQAVAAAATVYLNAQKQQREFVARAEAAKKAGQVVEPVVAPVKATQPKVETSPEEFLNNLDEETPVVSWYEQDTEAQINALTATARIKKNEGEAQRLVEVELKKLSQQQKKDLAEMLGVKPSEIAVSIVNDRGQMGYGAEARFEDSFTKGVRLASNGKGESFLIPVPDGDYQTVKPFAEALLKKVAPKEAQGRVEELVTLAKFFNNPEVVYAELKGLKEGKGDAQFARASAGAFDFGMREVKDGKLVRPGKPPLGTKDGWMTELEFRVNGGDLGPLQKDEVAFYKKLVPEAFRTEYDVPKSVRDLIEKEIMGFGRAAKNAKDYAEQVRADIAKELEKVARLNGYEVLNEKVHLQKLWDGLGKVGEQVKVVTYGQDGQVKNNFDRQQRDEALGKLDILGYHFDQDSTLVKRDGTEVPDSEVTPEIRALVSQYRRTATNAEEVTGPYATSYYNQISPFDTKKYPPVRIDVVLPVRTDMTGVDPNAPGSWQVAESRREAGGELWQPDNLHENLQNTLGWAMVQIVPHPVTGEKVMFVVEAQSRWAQERRSSIEDHKNDTKDYLNRPVKELWPETSIIWQHLKSKFPTADHKTAVFTKEMWQEEAARTPIADHPLLPIHQNLILKAVIKEAQKQGISKVAVSDGETAMMTERHDQNLQVNYSLARNENGDPVTVEIKNAKVEPVETKGEPIYILPYGWKFVTDIHTIDGLDGSLPGQKVKGPDGEIYRIQLASKGEKVFADRLQKDPLKPEQSGGMRLAYDTTMPSIMKRLVGDSEVQDFGPHKNANLEVFTGDERFALSAARRELEVLQQIEEEHGLSNEQDARVDALLAKIDAIENKKPGSPVFRNADGTPKTNATARVYDISNPSERVGTLFAQNAGKVYGAASYEAKKIFINSKAFDGLNPAQRAGFVFAHEHAHIAFEKAKSGIYGPEAQVRAELAEKWVMTADPQAKQVVRDVLMDLHLPKEIRDSEGVKDVLQNMEPNEWLANAMGMYAVGMVKPSKPKMAFSLLPRPIREFVEWGVKSMQNLTKAAKLWFKLRGDKAQYQQAKNVQSLMDSIRRSYRQAEWDAAEAEAFLRIQPEDMIEKVSDLQFAKGDVSAMTGKPAFKEQPKKWFEGQFASWVSPLHTIARLNKEFVEPVLRVFNSDNAKSNAIMNVEKALWGEYSTGNKIKINAKDMERVNSSPPLRKTFNRLMSYATQMNRRLVQFDPVTNAASLDMNAMTPQLRGEIAQFTPEAQKALTSYLIRMEMANKTAQKIIVGKEKEGFAARLSLILANRDSFKKSADFKKARAIADGVIEDLIVDRPDLAESKLAMLDELDRGKTLETAQIMTAQFKQLQEYYDTHPTFMSLRRYKEFKRRIRKPGQADDVLDADTPGELDKLVKEYEAKGWKADGKVIRGSDKKFKEQYQMNDDLLEIIRQQENTMRSHIETLMLPDNVKASLYDQLNTVDMVTREINGKEIYRPMGARKFAGDLDRFDALEQFMRYIPAAMSAVHNRALGAEVSFWMQNPELNNLQMQKDQFMALYEQSKTIDPEWARKLNKANATWHIGWNLPGHIAELFQPMAAHVHELVSQGDSLPRAMARLAKAEKEMLNVQKERIKSTVKRDDAIKVDVNGKTYEGLAAVWLKANGTGKDNVEIAELLTEKIHRVQRAPMSEVRQFVGEEHQKLEKLSLGEKQPTIGEMLSKPMHTYANAAMGFYSQFPMHNGVVALVSAYRQARAKGQTPSEAMNTAELFDLTVNNSGGRLERSEMYGKLGGAGHLVFSLSSYVRGRFAQLATYYKHGYNGDEFAGLTKGEQANARKAFKTMILAQLGAAGLMGLPFVGAGIALMEELLGEDIKGRMYEALDEVTEDPSLTRALTHGFATSFAESLGIPADLHSRFALSSFLGTNAYDGVSAKSFLGPSVAMLNSLWSLGGAMAQGKSLEESLTVGGPGGVKRLAEALSDDFQRDNPDASMAWSMMGFRPSEMTKRKEFKTIVDKREIESRREMEVAANRISEKMSQPGVARKMLLDEAMKMVPSGLTGQQKQMMLKKNIQDLSNKVATIEANKVAPEDPRAGIANRIAPEVSNTARSMGVVMPDPMERARAFAIQKTRSSLGQPVSDRPMKNAMMRDLQWGTNPWEF